MKYLWILRHGKAASDGPDGDDHSRPLTGRGRRQSTQVAAHMEEEMASGAPTPALVLSSSAARARTTAEPVHAALGADVPLEIERGLYGADPDAIVDRLRLLPDEVGAVMIVGHNPTFHDLALLLTSEDDPGGRARLEAGFPTAALALLALDTATWSALVPGSGHLEELFVPRAEPSNANRRAAGVATGDEVVAELEFDAEPPVVVEPPDVARALDADPVARRAFVRLTHSHERDQVGAIESAKRPETRSRRIEKAVTMLRACHTRGQG